MSSIENLSVRDVTADLAGMVEAFTDLDYFGRGESLAYEVGPSDPATGRIEVTGEDKHGGKSRTFVVTVREI